MVAQIPLTQGRSALVDDEEAGWLGHFSWHVLRCRNTEYAIANGRPGSGFPLTIYMHRLLVRAPNGVQVDHIDGNGLNNQGRNLRLATNGQNRANARHRLARYGYVGVRPSGSKWVARIRADGRLLHLGTFESPGEAAAAYNRAALRLFGEYAYLNEISGEAKW